MHIEKNIKKIREMKDVKQETLASMLGNGMTQRDISNLEKQKVVDEETLALIAKVLEVTPETIKKFKTDAVRWHLIF